MNYLGQPVFCERPNFKAIERDAMDDFSLVSVGVGKATPWKATAALRRTCRYPFLFDTARAQKCHRIFRSNRAERMLGFWLPLYLNDYRLVTAPTAGDEELTVEDSGLRHRLRDAGQFRHLAIVTREKLDLYGIDRVDLVNGYEIIRLTEPVKRTGTLSGTLCCAVMFARFGDDAVTFENLTDQVSQCVEMFVELPEETLEPPRYEWVSTDLTNDFSTALTNWSSVSFGGGTTDGGVIEDGAAKFTWSAGGINEQIRSASASTFDVVPVEGMLDTSNNGSTTGTRNAQATVTCGASISIAFWMKTSNVTDKIPVSLNSDTFASGPNLFYNGGKWNWNTGDGSSNPFVTGDQNLANNRWHFVVVTTDPTNGAKLYVDGVLVGTAAHRNPTTTAAAFRVGDFTGGGYALYGMYKRVALWNKELTQAEVTHYYTSDPLGHETDLAGFWACDEGTGSTINNAVSGGPSMTATGSQLLPGNADSAIRVAFKAKASSADLNFASVSNARGLWPYTQDHLATSTPVALTTDWQDFVYFVRPKGQQPTAADAQSVIILNVKASAAGSYYLKDMTVELATSRKSPGSVHSGSSPIYLYEITRGATTWRYANYGVDVTCNAQTWSAASISNGAINSESDMVGGVLDLQVSTDDANHPFRYFNRREAFLPTTVKVFKIEAGDTTFDTTTPLHSGQVTESKPGEKGRIRVRVSTVFRVGERSVPAVRPSRYCRHRLYDTYCGVNEATYTTAGTVDAIADTYVEASEFGAKATAESDPNWFALGTVTIGEEVRLCIGQAGDRLYLNAPFTGVAVGASVSAAAGCDRRVETCVTKFNNLANNLSFPYMPNQNPQFEGLENPQPSGGKK